MDGRDSFLGTATVATSAAVLKLITGGNLFSPAISIHHFQPFRYMDHRVGVAKRKAAKRSLNASLGTKTECSANSSVVGKESCKQETEHTGRKREASTGAIKKKKSRSGRICLVRQRRRRWGCAVHLMQG